MNILECENITRSNISAICFVAPGTGKLRHTDRAFHGLAFYPGDHGSFYFDDGRTVDFAPGTFVYLPKGSSYRVKKGANNCGCYCVNFDMDGAFGFEPFSFVPKSSVKLLNLLERAERLWKNKTHGNVAECYSVFYSIISILQREMALDYVPASKRLLLSPAVEYIRSNYTDCEMKTSVLPTLCGISPAYFRRLFSAVYGMPPVKYINSLRILRAKELILTDMHSSGEIARLSGFCDECYFRRVFKAETGCSPGRYLKNCEK